MKNEERGLKEHALVDHSSLLAFSQSVLQRRQMRGLNSQDAILDFRYALEQASRRWTGGVFAVLVVDAAMTGAHEKAGLGEPGDRATEVSAVDCKNLELLFSNVTHPTGNIGCFSIRGIYDWISIARQACLALRKLGERAKRKPRLIPWPPSANHRRKKIAHDRHRQDYTDGTAKEDSELHQHPTSR